MKTKRLIISLSVMLVLIITLCAVAAFASAPIDAMTDIEANLSEYKIGTTVTLENDGYIGIPVEISTYFDAKNHTAVPDFMANGGTPIIIYVVNTNTERVGTDTDTNIIRSMLERGYIVAVLDYLNSSAAKSPDLDWSAQLIRKPIRQGEYFNGGVIPEGEYTENFVAPAGCNVSLGNVFFEADKHAADGTLEKIVETWNNDFRSYNAETVIRWIDGDGNRKSTANGITDGSAPVWYTDADGKVADTDGTGEYIRIKHTWARDIFDCQDPDGSFIDLNLYINLVYPTSPEKPVPVASLANSSTYPTSDKTSADNRPHTNGLLFNGYASVVFDYLWQPMAREASYGYFDGQKSAGGYTGDQMNYSLHIYNDKRIYTAAMRYLRYINNENQSLYNFDETAFGVYGNSKGGWFTFLGSLELHDYTAVAEGMSLEEAMDARINSYTSKREFPNHAGETYYQSGKTSPTSKWGITVDGGELQPWLTYASGERAGEEILSYASVLYPCCGPAFEDMDVGGAPMFITSNLYDNYSSAWGSSNFRANLARTLDTPSLVFESPVGHMLTHSEDVTYGVDTYEAFFDFFGYYLKDEDVKVVYTVPAAKDADAFVGDYIVIKFIGSVSADDIALVRITDPDGNAAKGAWSSLYGNTEWTFTPTEPLLGNTEYTVTVPAELKGDNGTALGEDYVSTFTTGSASAGEAEINGLYIVATVPERSGNGFSVYFNVSNDAANVADLYAVSAVGASEGEYIGSVNLSGAGLYSIDATEYVMSKAAGERVVFLVKPRKAAGVFESFNEDFTALAKSGYTANNKSRFANYVRSADSKYAAGEKYGTATIDGADTVKFIVGMNGSRYPNLPGYGCDNEFYARTTEAWFTDNAINGGKILTEEDYGRKYTVTIRLYDTASRDILLYLESMTGKYLDNAYDTMDYDQSIFNLNTKAGEWLEFSFDYRVYETDFGVASEYEPKRLMLEVSPEGYIENGSRVDLPIYIDYVTVTETVTDIEISSAYLAATHDGGNDYKSPENAEEPIAIYSADTLVGEYASWSAALDAYVSGYTLKLQANYTLTDADNSDKLSDFEIVSIDLGGYSLTADTKENGAIWLKADAASSVKTKVNVKGGSLYITDTAVITYGGSLAVGSGRAFDVSFEDVFFGIKGRTMARSIVSDTESDGASSLKVNVTLDGCRFDIGRENIPYISTTLLATSETLDISYTVIGGEIKLDSERWIKILTTHKAAAFLKDGEGKRTTLLLPTAYTADASVGYNTEEGIANYFASESAGAFTVNTLEIGPLSTRYGIIPEEYASADTYPTVIFDKNGNFVKAYENFHGALNYFATYSDGDEWFMVLRRDYTFTTKYDNLSNGEGTLTVDLAGHTITCDGVMLYNADAKSNGDITVKTLNGTVALTTLGAVRILGWDTSAYDIADVKAFDFEFSDVTFKLADGATTEHLVTYNHVRSASGNPGPATNAMTFTDCTFDITGSSNNITLFTVGNANSGQALKGTYNIYGSEIIANNSSHLSIYNLVSDTESTIRFNKNDDGEYVEIRIPAGSSAPSDSFVSIDEGLMMLKSVGVADGSDVYTLEVNNLETKYGTVSEQFASAKEYPWVVFDKNGNCTAAGTKFTTTVAAAACAAGDGSVILLRRDFDMDSDVQAHGQQSLNKLNGKITVDLGGYTVTMGNGGNADAFIRCETYMAGYTTEINVINGKIIGGADPVVRYAAVGTRFTSGYAADSATNPHNFYVTLDSLDIVYDGSRSGARVLCYSGASGTAASGSNNNITVKDCDISIAGVTKTHYLLSADSKVPIKATVIGSTVTHDGVKAVDSDGNPIFKITSTGTEIDCTFARGADGEYMKLVMPTGIKVDTNKWSDTYDATRDDLRLSQYYVDGSNTVYVLTSLKTEYGTISASYESLLKYPWVVFDAEGNCTAAGTKFTTTIAAAACAAGDGSVILLRRDFDMDTDKQSGGVQNLAKINGAITIDLGGHTVTMGAGGSADAFVRAEPYAEGYVTSITVKNGRFIVGKDPIVRFPAIKSRGPEITLDDGTVVDYQNNTDKSKAHAFFVTLDGLDFELDERSDMRGDYSILYTYGDCTLSTHNNNLIVKNCNIDTSNNTNTNAKIFASHATVGASVTVIGGNIVFGNARPIIQGMNATSGSSIAFDKTADGNYTSFVFPKSHIAPTTVYNDPDGTELVFVKISDDGTDVIYRFRPAAVSDIDFVPKMSLTLDRDLILNVYVPEKDFLTSFTLDGAEYTDLGKLEKVTLDGKDYYLVSISLDAKNAARDIILKAKVDLGGKTATATFTFGVIKYAGKMLADGNDVEKTLVRDVLSYVRAAYTYFKTDDAETVSRINAILGEDYDANNAPMVEGSATASTTGLKSATFVLDGTPAMRFYLADGADATRYEFFINGTRVKTEISADGKYIDIDVYAYALCETVTYTIDGVESGSFHINAYYEWSKTQNNDDLTNLVARFWKYLQSARAYRDSVVGN